MKFLIAGLGSIGQRHVRNLRAALGNDAEIIAYRSRGLPLVLSEKMTTVPGAEPESHYGIKSFTDLEQALDMKPDAVFICNPTRFHIPVALAAAKRGCALFIEKPLSDSREGLEELRREVATRKLTVLVGYQLRFHPAFKKLKELIENGSLGKIISAHMEFGEYLPDMHPYEDYRGEYAARKDLGGGVVLCFIHEIDALIHLFGEAKRIFALGGKRSALEMDAEDTADILIEAGLNEVKIPVNVHLDFVQRPPRRRYRIIGESASVEWDYFTNKILIMTTSDRKVEEISFSGFERNQMFTDELQHFLACIDGREQPEVSFESGMKSLEVALLIKESMSSGKVINCN